MDGLFIAKDATDAAWSDRAQQQWVHDRFGPDTAVVDQVIVGRTELTGKIAYHGGCYAKATTYEPGTLMVGTRVRVLGRIPGTNILVVASLAPHPSGPMPTTSEPNPNWASRYFSRQQAKRSAAG